MAAFLGAMEGVAFVVEGEPGIGKTRLWRAAVALARDHGFRVLACRAAGSEVRLSFVCLGDLLEDVVGEGLGLLAAPRRAAVEVALRLTDPAVTHVDRRAVGLGVVEILRRLAAERPLLIAIDDLQWVDRSSAAALEFALRRLRGERVGLIATLRTDDEARAPLGLEGALGEGRVRMLTVGPLEARALHAVIRARLGTALPHPLLRRVHEAAGGNPFLALEIARALAAGGSVAVAGGGLPVPDNLRRLLRARLECLSPRTRRLLLAAAALSRPTKTVLGRWEGDEERAEADLERAVRAGVVELDGDSVRFAHPLLASVRYAEASSDARRRIHRELAAVVADPEERARHLALAVVGSDPAVAALLDDAARLARARGAPDAAAELSELARSRTPTTDRESTRRRLLESAEFQLEAGDTSQARVLLEQAATCSRAGDERAEAVNLLAQTHWFGDQREAVRLFAEAGREAESASVLAMSEFGLSASMRHLHEDLPAAAGHARAAVRLARQSGDEGVLAQTLAESAVLEGLLGRAGALRLTKQALSLEPSVLSLRVLRHPTYVCALVLLTVDRWDEARVALQVVWARAQERGDENALAWIAYHLSGLERLSGRFAQAAQWAEQGYEAALESGQESLRAMLLTAFAAIHADRGTVELARSTAADALAGAARTGMSHARIHSLAALGSLELSLGRAAEAHRVLAPAVAEQINAGVVEPGALRFVPDEIEALLALGELTEATRLLEPLEKRSRELGRASMAARCARCRALLLASQREFSRAERALEEALELHEQVAQPLQRARTLISLGIVRRRSRQKRPARTALEEAHEIFRALGACAWAERARAELKRIGGRSSAGHLLTPSEQRVAKLATAGRTNREIGAELFMSVRTVEWNLAKIFRKLGVRSRTELAAMLLSHQGRTPAA